MTRSRTKSVPQRDAGKTIGAAKAQSRSGIQSIEVGAALLDVLSHSEAALGLSALSAAAGMSPSKAHRYLTSFIRVGLVLKDDATGHYDLGRMARALGLATLRRLDVVREAEQAMVELRDRLNENVVLAVWDEGAPAVIKIEESSRALSVRVRIGARLPLLASATGQCFAAYSAPAMIAPFVSRELEPGGPAARLGIRRFEDVERLLESVRKQGVACSIGRVLNGIAALSAPIFRYPRSLTAALTVVGFGELDTAIPGPVSDALKNSVAKISARLGAVDDGHEAAANVRAKRHAGGR